MKWPYSFLSTVQYLVLVLAVLSHSANFSICCPPEKLLLTVANPE